MIRAALLGLAAAGAALPAVAAEGGAVRGGEHDGFTRLVLTVEPTTEWSLETVEQRAVLRFPGRKLAFDTGGVYDKIPRDRVRAVSVATEGGDTVVTVDLACDCRVSTSFVGAQYLAVDVADRDAAPAARDAGAPLPRAAADSDETKEERAVREARAVSSAEEVLIRQIERAADQGIVRYAEPPAAAGAGGQAAEAGADGNANGSAAVDANDVPDEVMAALAGQDQVLATTVYDRDTRAALNGKALADRACLDDARLDVGSWSDGRTFVAQLSGIDSHLLAEFDVPDTESLRDLARLYVRFGFGAEAETLLKAFPDAPVEDRGLLLDLARAVEGRPVAPAGPLAIEVPCPGAHGLWLALGGAAPAWHDAATFASVQAAFAALPVDLRVTLAPQLIDRLLAAGRVPEARVVLETAIRPGAASTPDLDLAAARIAAAEGHPQEAIRALNALIETDGHASLEALTELARVVVDARIALPPRVVTDLGAAALQYRGTAQEAGLRTLLVEALAGRGELAAALEESRGAIRDLPAQAPAFSALILRLIAAADPATVGTGAYAETALAAMDLLSDAPAADPARVAIGNRLVTLGLPDPALKAVAPAVAAGDAAARMVAAMAEIGRGAPEAAQAALGPLATPEAAALRARAFALSGAYSQAADALRDGGLGAEAAPYAWPAGDWPMAGQVAGDPTRKAMASYMSTGAGQAAAPAPAADPAALSPDLAFQEPLPPLDKPSLDAARRLLSAGGKIGGVVQGVIAEGAAANATSPAHD